MAHANHRHTDDDPSHPSQPEQPQDSLEQVQQEALQLLGQRKRRKRVRYSCTECHRRKHKCDRETLCAKCVERGDASSCLPYDGSEHDVFERMRQLETVLSRLVHASRPTLNSTSSPLDRHASAASSSSVAPQTRAAKATSSAPFSPQNGPSSAHSLADGLREGGATPAYQPPLQYLLVLRLALKRSSSPRPHRTIRPRCISTDSVREGSLPTDEIRTLASALPPQHQTSALLDVFFRHINPLFFPFDETWFREAINANVVWGDPGHPTYARDAPDHISLIALLYAVLALTFLSQPRSFGSEADGAARAARMSFQCRRCHMLATSIQCHDPFLVLSYMLLARFSILQRQAKESWLSFAFAIREAEILGLHRLGRAPDERSQGESREAAMRRTIWMHLYFEASFHSLIIGQSPLIHDAFCDTAPPQPSLPTNADPMHFDLATILRIRYDLSRIVGKVLHLFLSDQHDMDSDAIFHLDHELQVFRDSLPLLYRLDDKHTGFTSRHPSYARDDNDSFRKIALHRFVLHNSICFVLISLHLPNLRRGSTEPGFERSRQAAIQARAERLDWPDHLATDRFVGGRFSYFHATSTLGICLLSEPDMEWVYQLASLLDEFLEFAQDHQRQQAFDSNRCVRQEIGIVSLIRARIKRRLDADRSNARHRTERLESPSQPFTASSQRQHTGSFVRTEPFTARTAVESAQETVLPTFDSLLPFDLGAQNENAQLTQTSHAELGEDMYDWWSWLVPSLHPSDLSIFPSANTGTDTDSHT